MTWQHLAKFAVSRGFQIAHAKALVAKEEQYHSQLALDYLRKAKPTCPTFSSDHVQRVLTAVRSYKSPKTREPILELPYLSLDRRSGRPFERDFIKEKEIMFLPQLYSGPPCEDVNLRLLRRDLFSCIFISLEFQASDPLCGRGFC